MEWSFRIWERMFHWTVLDPKRNPEVDAESVSGEQITISPRGRVDRNLASGFAVLSMGARTRMIQQYQRSQSTITTGCPCEGGSSRRWRVREGLESFESGLVLEEKTGSHDLPARTYTDRLT